MGEAAGGWSGHGALACDGPPHTRIRDVAGQALSARIATPTAITSLTDALVDVEQPGVVDLKEVARALTLRVLEDLLGVPARSRRPLRVRSLAAEPAAGARNEDLGSVLVELVKAKTDDPGDDLTSALVAGRSLHGDLAPEEVVDVLARVVTGQDATTELITNTAWALLTHPAQRDAVLGGQVGWGDVVEEAARWMPPLSALATRSTTTALTMGDVTIPARQPVLLCPAAAGRDHRRYRDAHHFRVGRADPAHLAFGAGRHACMGASLARMQTRMFVASLWARYPRVRLAVPASEVRAVPSVTTWGVQVLPVVLGPARRTV